MQRRRYLAAVSVAAGTLVAGCLGDDDSDDNNADDTTTDQPAGNQTDQASILVISKDDGIPAETDAARLATDLVSLRRHQLN